MTVGFPRNWEERTRFPLVSERENGGAIWPPVPEDNGGIPSGAFRGADGQPRYQKKAATRASARTPAVTRRFFFITTIIQQLDLLAGLRLDDGIAVI